MKGIKSLHIALAAAAAISIVAASPAVYAASEISVMQTEITKESVILCLGGELTAQTAQVQIGTEKVGSVEINELDESTPIVTWLLVDNSLSIKKADRERMSKLLTDLVAGKLPGEKITLCTISDHLEIIAKEEQSYAELKTKIDSIKHEDQETYLTDVLDAVLSEEEKRTEYAYVRCIVISDGVDNNPAGITREELTKRLSEKNMPIYTFGCQGEAEALKAMYALSRATGAESWALSDVEDTLSITKKLGTEEIPLRADIVIPETLRDGTVKGIRLVLEDGSAAETQVTMPFGTVTPRPEAKPEPTPAPAPEPSPEPEETKTAWMPIAICIVCGIVIASGITVTVILLLRRKKEKNRVRTVSEGPQRVISAASPKTEFIGGENSSTDTMILVGDNRNYMLSLTDVEHVEKYFEVPLRDKISIGRSTTNQVVIDYDNSVSASHCEIIVAGNMLKIRDLSSRNGTFLDGKQVVDTAEIINGSTIKLGRVVLKVGVR